MTAEDEWRRCALWIEAALEYGGGTHNLDDVLALVLAGDAQFWSSPNAAAVTEINEYPRFKCLHLWLCGGDMNEILHEMLPKAEAWARSQGCSKTTTAGRIGWGRVMAPLGYRPWAEMCMKDL